MSVCWRSLSRYGFSWREQAVERRSGTGDDAGETAQPEPSEYA
jgi:hypothetical protein